MTMGTCVIEFDGEEWEVDFNYSAGTNYVITSTSLEPNDPRELDIEGFCHNTLPMSQEFLDAFFESNEDEIYELVWEHIKG